MNEPCHNSQFWNRQSCHYGMNTCACTKRGISELRHVIVSQSAAAVKNLALQKLLLYPGSFRASTPRAQEVSLGHLLHVFVLVFVQSSAAHACSCLGGGHHQPMDTFGIKPSCLQQRKKGEKPTKRFHTFTGK